MKLTSLEKNEVEALFLEIHEKKYYFYFKVKTRFSDFFGEGFLHFSKCFEYFEIARFDILDRFQKYRMEKHRSKKIEKIYFVVVKANYEHMQNLSVCDEVTIKTRLIVEKIPYLKFRQMLMDVETSQVYAKADLKIALLDQEMKGIKKWDEEVFFDMISCVKDLGKKEDEI